MKIFNYTRSLKQIGRTLTSTYSNNLIIQKRKVSKDQRKSHPP